MFYDPEVWPPVFISCLFESYFLRRKDRFIILSFIKAAKIHITELDNISETFFKSYHTKSEITDSEEKKIVSIDTSLTTTNQTPPVISGIADIEQLLRQNLQVISVSVNDRQCILSFFKSLKFFEFENPIQVQKAITDDSNLTHDHELNSDNIKSGEIVLTISDNTSTVKIYKMKNTKFEGRDTFNYF